MIQRRKLLFRDGTTNEFLLIITDAPKEAIVNYCIWRNQKIEDGWCYEKFAPLKAKYYVKELLDSEVDDFEDADIIGYDVVYDFGQYSKLTKSIEGYRTIKMFAGMTGEFEVISTNAPNSVILANMKYVTKLEEEGSTVENPYAIIEAMGFTTNVLGSHEDFSSDDLENAIIDESFDYYNV